MPQALLHPGVYIEEVPSGVRTITGVATSIALFIGWARKGPTDRAVRLTSFADFERVYGGLDIDSLLGYAVRQFYDNGGSDAYVIRIVNTAIVAAVNTPPTAPAIPAAAKSSGKLKIDANNQLNIRATSEGEWGDKVVVQLIATGTSFRLEIRDVSGNVLETFVNLSLTATAVRYAPSVVNGSSAYIENLSVGPFVAGAVNPVTLGGGKNGSILTAADPIFTAAVPILFDTGNIADRLDLFNLICVPGLTDKTAVGLLQAHAKTRRAFLLIDCAADATLSLTGTKGVGDPANLPMGNGAANSALYFPWVLAPNPLRSGAIEAFPPCGIAAGVMARTDADRGVWKAPAGTEAALTGVAGLTINMSDAENGLLNPRGINCLRTLPVYGNVAWGARTLDGDDNRGSEWKYIPVRRTALFLEESLYRGTQWVVFEPNDEPLWAQIRLNVGAFLNGLFRQGAFQGKTPKQAYFVKCDRETTTQADINLGIVNILVGFAPLKPAEFVVIKIQQIAGDIPT